MCEGKRTHKPQRQEETYQAKELLAPLWLEDFLICSIKLRVRIGDSIKVFIHSGDADDVQSSATSPSTDLNNGSIAEARDCSFAPSFDPRAQRTNQLAGYSPESRM